MVERDDAADPGPVPEVILAPHGGHPVSDQEKMAWRYPQIIQHLGATVVENIQVVKELVKILLILCQLKEETSGVEDFCNNVNC